MVLFVPSTLHPIIFQRQTIGLPKRVIAILPLALQILWGVRWRPWGLISPSSLLSTSVLPLLPFKCKTQWAALIIRLPSSAQIQTCRLQILIQGFFYGEEYILYYTMFLQVKWSASKRNFHDLERKGKSVSERRRVETQSPEGKLNLARKWANHYSTKEQQFNALLCCFQTLSMSRIYIHWLFRGTAS